MNKVLGPFLLAITIAWGTFVFLTVICVPEPYKNVPQFCLKEYPDNRR